MNVAADFLSRGFQSSGTLLSAPPTPHYPYCNPSGSADVLLFYPSPAREVRLTSTPHSHTFELSSTAAVPILDRHGKLTSGGDHRWSHRRRATSFFSRVTERPRTCFSNISGALTKAKRQGTIACWTATHFFFALCHTPEYVAIKGI